MLWVSLGKDPAVELLGVSLSLVKTFVVKSILSDVSIATPAFSGVHCMKYLFPCLSV